MSEVNTEYVEKLKAELAASKKEADALRHEAEAAKAAEAAAKKTLKDSGIKTVTGKYKGYSFAENHFKIRDAEGRLHDTQEIMDAAKAGDAKACAILDRLIKIEYAYFTK